MKVHTKILITTPYRWLLTRKYSANWRIFTAISWILLEVLFHTIWWQPNGQRTAGTYQLRNSRTIGDSNPKSLRWETSNFPSVSSALLCHFQGASQTLNFTYAITNPADGLWGKIEDDGLWSGAIGWVVQGRSDVIFSAIYQTYPRRMVSSYKIQNHYQLLRELMKSSIKFARWLMARSTSKTTTWWLPPRPPPVFRSTWASWLPLPWKCGDALHSRIWLSPRGFITVR